MDTVNRDTCDNVCGCVLVSVGSGIYVDLGGRTEGYREVSGKCPVFGKVIHLHQPVAYRNTFLDDVPSPPQAYRKPLPGGFNSPHVTGTGRKFSPVSDAEIRSRLGGEQFSDGLFENSFLAGGSEPLALKRSNRG